MNTEPARPKYYYFAQWIRGANYDKDRDPDHIYASSYIHLICLQRQADNSFCYSDRLILDDFIAEISDPDHHFEMPQGDAFNLYGEKESTEQIIEGLKANAREYYTFDLTGDELKRFEAATVTACGGWLGAVTAAAQIEQALNENTFKTLNECDLTDEEKQQYIKEMLPRLRAAITNPKTHKIRERSARAFWRSLSKFFEQEKSLLHIQESKNIVRLQRSIANPFKVGHTTKTQLLKPKKREQQIKAFVNLFDKALAELPPERQAKEFEMFLDKLKQYALVESTGLQFQALLHMLAAARAAQLCYDRSPWSINPDTTGVLSQFDEAKKRPNELHINANVFVQSMGLLTSQSVQNTRSREALREAFKHLASQTWLIEQKITNKATGESIVKETVTQLFKFTSSRDEKTFPTKAPRGAEYWTFSGIADLLLPIDIEHESYEKLCLRSGVWLNRHCADRRTADVLSKAAFWIMLRLNDFRNAAEMDLSKKFCEYEDELAILNIPRSGTAQKAEEKLDLLRQALIESNITFTWAGDRFKAVQELADPKRITIGDAIARGDDPTPIIETKIQKTVRKEVTRQLNSKKKEHARRKAQRKGKA